VPAPTFRLLAISDRAGLEGEDLEGWLAGIGAAGIDAVQIREKDLDDRALFDLVRRARALLPPATRLLVNGRADIAIAAGMAGVDGVHLPADGVPLRALRERFGPGLLLGRSTHRVEEVEQALREGADYATFGPVWPTPSKERYGPPAGVGELARAAATGLPVYALGGVTLARFAEAAAAGAAGVAAIRLFRDPGQALEAARASRTCFPDRQET